MAGKVRHLLNREGRYFARVMVPAALHGIIGKTELRQPLGGDRRIAERNLPGVVGAMLERIESARLALDGKAQVSPRVLSTGAMLRAHYQEEVGTDAATRNATFPDGQPVHTRMPDSFRQAHLAVLQRIAAGHSSNEEAAAVIGWAIDRYAGRGVAVPKLGTPEWRELARSFAAVQMEVVRQEMAADLGQAGTPPTLPILNEKAEAPFKPKVRITELFKGYLAEMKASGKGAEAERRWKPVINDFIAYVGHDDARRVTKAHVLGWKEERAKTLAAKTLRDVYLASIRVIFQWGVDNDKIETNPVSHVKIRLGKKIVTREKGFTDAEAVALLKAARDYRPVRNQKGWIEPKAWTLAKRWTPWLCAYTGARIAEMTQLRKSDVREQNGIHYLRITPEAGSVKTSEYRDVPLHPHLITLGFLDFVAKAADGPLFYGEKDSTGGIHPSKWVARQVREWIRSIDAVGRDVPPNHGWRHRFKTQGLELGMHGRVQDAIQGHAPRTAGDNYGDVTLTAKLNAVKLLPQYVLE